MFIYEKKLQYPVKIANPNPKLASFIITQYGGRYGGKLSFWSWYCYVLKNHVSPYGNPR